MERLLNKKWLVDNFLNLLMIITQYMLTILVSNVSYSCLKPLSRFLEIYSLEREKIVLKVSWYYTL